CRARYDVSEDVTAAAGVPAGSPGGAGKTGSKNPGQGGVGNGVDSEKSEARDPEKMKAAFAAERDAILRRVGVKKESSGGGGGGNGGKATGRGWWGLGGRAKETTEMSPTLPPSLRRGGGAEEPTRSGADDREGAESEQHADPPRAPGKVGGAVKRVGGTLRRVGGVVRKAGGAVNKVRRAARDDAAALKKSETLEEHSVG
ncbi:unnamed protein product, partial [Laminaria digitata]